MILIISICKEKLHENEFVRPIERVLESVDVGFKTIHYTDLDNLILNNFDKVIICGTSLKDNAFLKDKKMFEWIKDFDRPVLGICGGMHLILYPFSGKVKTKKQIGMFRINFDKDFLGFQGEKDVYLLHSRFVDSDDFEVFSFLDCPQAVKHKSKSLYGVLFHPEVRNKDLILNFATKNI